MGNSRGCGGLVGVRTRNGPQHVQCAYDENDDGPELRNMTADEAVDRDSHEDESQEDRQAGMMKGPCDTGKKDHVLEAFRLVSQGTEPVHDDGATVCSDPYCRSPRERCGMPPAVPDSSDISWVA